MGDPTLRCAYCAGVSTAHIAVIVCMEKIFSVGKSIHQLNAWCIGAGGASDANCDDCRPWRF